MIFKSSILKNELINSEFKTFSYNKVYVKRNQLQDIIRQKQSIRKRKNINNLKKGDEETILLKEAIEKAISSGEYAKFVTYHSQYMWDIHTMRAQINQRFLPWHRIYLLKFEEMLNEVMKKEYPNRDFNIALPYWDWEHDHKIPEFLEDLTSTIKNIEIYLWDDSGTFLGTEIRTLTVKRFPGTIQDPRVRELPTEDQVNRIRRFRRFDRFTIELESGNRMTVGPHALVHVWVGGQNPTPDRTNPFDELGAMAQIEISPLDFCFWCHHGNIDRIWAGWQKKQEEEGNPGVIYPNLIGEDAKMHPWPEYIEPLTRNIEELGYTYDEF